MRRHKRKPDRAYLGWIASLSCVVCDSLVFCGECGHAQSKPRDPFCVACDADLRPFRQQFFRAQAEVAHVGDRGLMQKCSDRETIPLCAEHHRTGKDAHHVLGKRFWAHHGLDRDALVAELQRRYDAEVAAA